MHYRKLGSTGLRVSEIGFGAWGIGGATPQATSYGQTDDRVSLKALEVALDSGINFYDTSNVYGLGHSERLIGQAFRKCRERIIIATKAGFTDYESPADFSGSAIRKSVEGSLKRLDTDYVDLLQLHNPDVNSALKDSKLLNTLEKLLEEGKINNVGVSIKSPSDIFELISCPLVAVIQANFNMLDIRVLESGLPTTLERSKVGFIARTPMSFGFLSGELTGDENFPPDDHRSRWPRSQLKLWASGARQLLGACEAEELLSPSEKALSFCLAHSWVSTVIPGMLSAAEVIANAGVSELTKMSQSSIDNICELHASNTFMATGK